MAFNQEAYDEHGVEVRDEGVIIFNSNEFQLEGDPRGFGLPFDELARSTGNTRAANMVIHRRPGSLGGHAPRVPGTVRYQAFQAAAGPATKRSSSPTSRPCRWDESTWPAAGYPSEHWPRLCSRTTRN